MINTTKFPKNALDSSKAVKKRSTRQEKKGIYMKQNCRKQNLRTKIITAKTTNKSRNKR